MRTKWNILGLRLSGDRGRGFWGGGEKVDRMDVRWWSSSKGGSRHPARLIGTDNRWRCNGRSEGPLEKISSGAYSSERRASEGNRKGR